MVCFCLFHVIQILHLPITHELSPTSHPSMNASSSNPNSVQFLPHSNLSIRNGSDSCHFDNSGAWSNRNPFGFWNPIFAVAPFLNIPKNLPQTCLLNICRAIIGPQRGVGLLLPLKQHFVTTY
jgi:hypothetical protein